MASSPAPGIRLLVINRPGALNALNTEVMAALRAGLAEAVADASVGVVVVTGGGGRAFVAGADIGQMATMGAIAGKAFALEGQELAAELEHCPKPVIAAIHGFCLGGGNELAMACHMRVATESSVFGQPEVKLGLMPGMGGTQRLTRLVGRGRAFEIILTGRTVSAGEALAMGLINAVVPVPEWVETVKDGKSRRHPHGEKALAAVLDAAYALAGQILAAGPVAVRHSLEAIVHGSEMTLAEGNNLEANLFGLLFATTDQKEGTAAFLAKREPAFRGE
ncbi:enoyl-CoA hydratase/isomerase family protein [bacterium]|nr:enoyl-CoA hydratase/isomerase family protein [bacterium]